MESAAVDEYRLRRALVLSQIASACQRVGRDPSEVHLLAVSKTVAPDQLRAAQTAGLTDLAENRVHEAAVKIPLVPGVRWHLIGPLQSNKARRAVELFATIQSVDSVELAERLDRLVREIRGLSTSGDVPLETRLVLLLQVNVDDDPAKAGFAPAALPAALPRLLELTALRIDGLMTIGRPVAQPEEARPTFRRLRHLAARLRTEQPDLGPELSMGMSADYPIAVEEGATIVRVGRALFGDRAEAPDHRPADGAPG